MNNSYKKYDLPKLILKAKNGDKLALEELIYREQKNVHSTLYHLKASSEDISDISQEILLKLSKNITKLKNPQMFKSWLKQIIIHQFYDTLRKKRKIPLMFDINQEGECAHQIPDYSTNPYSVVVGSELDKIIKTAIGKLSCDFQTAIIMRELEGLSYEEIAIATKSSIGTVKSRIARARGKLQEYIEPYIGDV